MNNTPPEGGWKLQRSWAFSAAQAFWPPGTTEQMETRRLKAAGNCNGRGLLAQLKRSGRPAPQNKWS